MNLEIDIVCEHQGWQKEEMVAAEKAARHAVAFGLLARERAANHSSAPFSLALVFASNDFVQNLNHKFRKTNKPTNVLAFPAGEATLLGDVVMAHEILWREAQEKNIPAHHHAAHLAAHGVLHLLGFTHEEDGDAEKMEQVEIQTLAFLGIANPYQEKENAYV